MTEGDDILMVSRPDDASLRACEQLMRHVRQERAGVSLVLSRTRKDLLRKGAQMEASVAEAVLDCPVLGCIPEDERIALCGKKGKTALESDGPAQGAIRKLLNQLLKLR